MSSREQIKFQIALGAVKHFGKNLYTTNPPAMAELIANSWDAYAKKCQIIVNDDGSLYLIDDGIGMTDHELK
jgi:HSP90 family molecular chaperone